MMRETRPQPKLREQHMLKEIAIAVDVGGTGIKCALVAPDGAVVHAERHPTRAERGPEAVVDTIVEVAAGLAARANADGWNPIAAGVVVPAVIDEEKGIAVWSANLGLRDVPLRALLSRRLGLPVALGHDVRAGAAAEARLGAGRGVRRVYFLAIGTGIAGGYVRDGAVDPGAHGAAGEIGHMVVRRGLEANACTCGQRGCLEAHASAAAIGRAYGSTAQEVAMALARGDAAAQAVWDDAVGALADGLLVALALYDPELIVLGGGLAQAGDRLVVPVAAALAAKATFHFVPPVRAADLGDAAGSLGAALLALDLMRSKL
jgi:glucokinase